MLVISSGQTDLGRVRKNNEDSLAIADDLHLYVVADGMGGHLAGEVASSAAVKIIADFIKITQGQADIAWPYPPDDQLSRNCNRLKTALRSANREIFQSAQQRPECRGMGTTAVALLFSADKVCIAHAGDSRAYRITDISAAQLNKDHTLYAEQFGDLPSVPENFFTQSLKNILTRSLGLNEDVEIDTTEFTWKDGDIYLLCSDGLSNYVSTDEMQVVVKQFGDQLQDAGRALINLANTRGGSDNITVVIIQACH